MHEVEFIEKVKEILKDRKCAYGSAKPLFQKVARKWSTTFGIDITPEQVIIAMIDFKTIRYKEDGSHKHDSAFDIAGYAALLANFFEDDESQN